jgi:hypothetical protein
MPPRAAHRQPEPGEKGSLAGLRGTSPRSAMRCQVRLQLVVSLVAGRLGRHPEYRSHELRHLAEVGEESR